MFTFSDTRTDALIRVLRAHPEGASLRQIAAQMDPVPEERTLQRWLGKLIGIRLVTRDGGSKNTRYFAGNGRHAMPVKKRTPKAPVVKSTPAPVPEPTPEPSTPPAPKPPRLPPQYRALFDRVAPKIIRLGYVDSDAASELATAACRAWPNATPDQVNAFVLAAQDAFDDLRFASGQSSDELRTGYLRTSAFAKRPADRSRSVSVSGCQRFFT